MRIAIYGRNITGEFYPAFKKLLEMLMNRGIELVCYNSFYHAIEQYSDLRPYFSAIFNDASSLNSQTDILFSVGGDGTFLDAVGLVKESGVPILGINSGRLGFLANVAQNEFAEVVECIERHDYKIRARDLIRLSLEDNPFLDFSYGLNEVSVLKTEQSSLINIDAYIGEDYLTTYWADGLIVATPTGSTAYSLSGGGPIVSPECENLIITPVCPHNLTVRPLIVPKREKIKLDIKSRSGEFILSLDSRMCKVPDSQTLFISSGDFKLNIIELPWYNYYDTLRNKLRWGEDKRTNNTKMNY